MPPVLSKVKHKKLVGQSREIVANVMSFMANEASARYFTIPVQKVQIRTAAATGVSVRAVRGVKKEQGKIERGERSSFSTPDTSRERTRTVTGLNEFDKCIVRRTVHEYYVKEKCCPTIGKLKDKLQESIGFKGCSTSLRRILKELGFKWTKTKNHRKVLTENMDIRIKRITYLKNLKHYRQKGYPIIFTDEIFLTSHDCIKKRCTENCDKRLISPLNKGQQLVIVHAGGLEGFVPNACFMWKLNKNAEDNNDKMNWPNYMKWVETKLLPNLKPNSMVVIDSAAYHNMQTDKAPTCISRREDMIKWLIDHNIPFYQTMLKPQLYELIRLHKTTETRYMFDELLKQHGHIVLRLPRYHSDLNPIELLWVKLKIWLAQQNKTYKIDELARVCEERLNTIGKDEWLDVCAYVENIEKQYNNEEIIDTETEKIFNSLGGECSDSDEDLEDDSSDEYSVSEEEDSDDEFVHKSIYR